MPYACQKCTAYHFFDVTISESLHRSWHTHTRAFGRRQSHTKCALATWISGTERRKKYLMITNITHSYDCSQRIRLPNMVKTHYGKNCTHKYQIHADSFFCFSSKQNIFNAFIVAGTFFFIAGISKKSHSKQKKHVLATDFNSADLIGIFMYPPIDMPLVWKRFVQKK